MANLNSDITVSVEKAMHDAIAQVLHTLMKDHGLRVDAVDIQWRDVTQMKGDANYQIVTLQIMSTSFPKDES